MRRGIVERIGHYFGSLGHNKAEIIEGILSRQIKCLNIQYFNDYGKPRSINLVLRPWLIRQEEVKFLHHLVYAFKIAHDKLFALYFKEKDIQDILPLRPGEKEWFSLINKEGLQKPQMVFGRWDTNASFGHKGNIQDLKFLETNTVGIGGIHYIPVVSEALKAVLKIELEKDLWPYHLGHQPDPRHLLAEEIKWHARLIGRRHLNVAFIENRDFLAGTVELPELTKYFLKKGIKAILADPRDLRLKGKDIYYKDIPIDIIYRDSELQELIDLEKKGHGMEALKQAFINNQVISSIAGELDHKSSFEIFTSPEFLHFFTPKEIQIFKKHIPWTRILRQRNTTDPALRRVDLVPYVIKNKDKLVIKPNRAYGGKGVVIGKLVKEREWHSYITRALRKSGDFVVQELVKINQERFPFFNQDKKIEFDYFYSVSGIVVTRKSTAVLGRFSKEMVVNVARKGGIVPVFKLV